MPRRKANPDPELTDDPPQDDPPRDDPPPDDDPVADPSAEELEAAEDDVPLTRREMREMLSQQQRDLREALAGSAPRSHQESLRGEAPLYDRNTAAELNEIYGQLQQDPDNPLSRGLAAMIRESAILRAELAKDRAFSQVHPKIRRKVRDLYEQGHFRSIEAAKEYYLGHRARQVNKVLREKLRKYENGDGNGDGGERRRAPANGEDRPPIQRDTRARARERLGTRTVHHTFRQALEAGSITKAARDEIFARANSDDATPDDLERAAELQDRLRGRGTRVNVRG